MLILKKVASIKVRGGGIRYVYATLRVGDVLFVIYYFL